MNSTADTTTDVLFSPTALLPVGLALSAVLVVLTHFGLFGSDPGSDEGAAAHIWQLLMAAQVPALALFTAKWFRRARRQCLNVLTMHGFAIAMCIGLAARAPLYFLSM
jgi:hypothetical protein